MADATMYVPWYRVAESVLGKLVPSGLTDDAVKELVSPNDWLIIPSPGESGRKQAIQRGEPNIYFSIGNKMSLGLVCNTLRSIKKMRNILTGFHSDEKSDFLRLLKGLDENFETSVNRKIYEHHFRQSPKYKSTFEHPSNDMNEKLFEKLFTDADEIHKEGRKLAKQGGKYKRLLPTVSLAETNFPSDKSAFIQNLQALKPLYELSLVIKTDSEIRKEMAKDPVGQRLRCPKCGYGPIPDIIARSCPRCHTKMEPVKT